MSRVKETPKLQLSDPSLQQQQDDASATGNEAAAALTLMTTQADFNNSFPTGRDEPSLPMEKSIQPTEVAEITSTASEAASAENVAKNISIGPQHFDLLKLIGEGAFGKVIMVRNRLNQQLYAMKVISKKLLRKKNNITYMKSERDILTKVYHPFIVRLWFAFQTEQRLFLVMDFLGGGELFYHLKRRGLILEAEARIYLAEMVLAIEFLHSIGVVHRDLKPENVLLRPSGHICITDFGLAKEVGDNTQVRTLCGTSEYMAPEMLLRNGYTKAVDWWSLGALFYEMLAGKPPFVQKKGETSKDLDRKIIQSKVVMPSYLQADTVALLRGFLEKDSMKRLGSSKSTMFVIGGVTALKAQPFFKGIDWKKVYNCELTPPIDPTVVTYEGMVSPSGVVASPNTTGQCTPGRGATSTPGGGKGLGGRAGLMSPSGSTANLAEVSPSPRDQGQDNDAAEHRHFHVEFTKQPLSPSVIEDALSENVSESATPISISRSHSKENLSAGQEAYEEKDRLQREKEVAAYCDFTYVDASFSCTQAQVESFHTELADKLAKAEAKKKRQARKDEGKALKEKEAEAALLLVEQAKEKLKKEKEAVIAAAQARAEQIGRMRERMTLLKRTKEACMAFMNDSEDRKQKAKAASRKLRAVVELQSRVDSGEVTLKALSTDQREKLSRRSALESVVAEEEQGLKDLLEQHDSAYSGKLQLTEEEEQEILMLEKRIEGGDDFENQPLAPAPAPASAPAPAAAPAFDSADVALKAEIDLDIEKRRQEMLAQRDAFDRAEEAKEAQKKAEQDTVIAKKNALVQQAAEEEQAARAQAARATSVFGKASITPPASPRAAATAKPPPPPEPAVQKYIPVHLRAANASAVQTASFANSPSSPGSAQTPAFVPKSALSTGSVWGRTAPLSGSTPLSAYKDAAPVSPPARDSKSGDHNFSSAASSSTVSPSNYYSTHSSPASSGAPLTANSKEFVPTFQRPAAPILQQVPPMPHNWAAKAATSEATQQQQQQNPEQESAAASPNVPAAAPVLSWAAKISMSKK